MHKNIFLLAAIVVVLLAGIFVLQPHKQEGSMPQEQEPAAGANETSTPAFTAPSEEVIRSIIPEIIGPQFDETTATHTMANLDGENATELIVGAIEGPSDALDRPATAVIALVSLQNEQGEFSRIGSVQYTEWLRGVPEVKELRDVTGEGIPEIIVSLQYGGASSWTEGILRPDIARGSLQWLQLHTKEGQTQDAVFVIAASAGHWNSVEWHDANGDGSEELIEIFAQRLPFEDEKIVCEANAYVWDGTMFGYAAQLSETVLSQLSENCEL